ncbi:cytochrome c oxidase subunit II [Halobaculum sp. D14]|uniref:cytochrome c oxidase subunit II n=1 Tax=Halobaculum sp. D14 TaxID=3421642 RepID=UPI003EBAAC28
MKGKRLGTLFAALVGSLLFAGTAAAQPSSTAGLINELNVELLWVAVPVTIFVEAVLIYTVLKFKDADEAKPTKENRRLEVTWTIATAVILLFVGAASYGVLADPAVTHTKDMEIAPDENDVHVEAVAYQWNWRMNYPEHNITELTAEEVNVKRAQGLEGPTIVVPKGQQVYFTTTSEDVIHSMHVPKLGLKQDSIPGQRNTIMTTPLKTGVYQGYCAEYCGVGHSRMYFNVVVVTQDTYDTFIENQTQPASGGNSTSTSSDLAAPSGLTA